MRHRIEEIERLAMTGCGLPEGYSQPEQLLFLSLRILHWEIQKQDHRPGTGKAREKTAGG